ncbi:ribonuclease H-like domain-containing protein [Tanacetum coccineum]
MLGVHRLLYPTRNPTGLPLVILLRPLIDLKLLHSLLVFLIEEIIRDLGSLIMSQDPLTLSDLMIIGIEELLGVLICSSSGYSDEQLSTLISLIKETSINGKGVQANMAVGRDPPLPPLKSATVHKVARDSKLIVAFDELKCYILNQDLKAGKVPGTGRQFGGLYYFDGNQGRELKSSCINNVCFVSKYTWHCRLGHPANQVLNVLRPNLLFENDKSDVMCDICQRAKHTRELFPLSDHVSTEIGELVHLDL